MGTALAVAFPWGRYHATPWGRNVNEAAVEWPPSAWRILRALYATWKSRAPHLDEVVVLGLLDALAEPPEYVVPPHTEAHTRHFMPDIASGTDMAVDAFAVLERGAELTVRWPFDLPDAQRAALAELAELLPYLGRADSVCEARLVLGEPPADGTTVRPVAEHADGAGDGGALRLLVPGRPLDVTALTASTAHVRGRLRLLDPPGAAWVDYTRPRPAVPVTPSVVRPAAPVDAVRWSIATPARPTRKAAVAMTDVLRHACMSKFGKRFDGAVSPTLAGKDAASTPLEGHGHAHYLAFAADPGRADASRLDTLVLWAPAGLDDRELEALAGLDRLTGFAYVSDFRRCRLGLEAYGRVTDVAPELVGPATVWESHTPFAPPRHAKRRVPWPDHIRTQVVEELTRRGIAAPDAVEVLPGDWPSYRTHRHTKNERLRDARRATGVRVIFPEPVRGPIAIGALSHFGLGLLLPVKG